MATTREATVQHRSGAPGSNRTSDTRFRKHTDGVTGCSYLDRIVLHGPRFCAVSVMSRIDA